MKFTSIIDRYNNIYLCEVNERSNFHVIRLYYIRHIFRNTHATDKLRNINGDYEAHCESKQVDFVKWLVDLHGVVHFVVLYIGLKFY